MKILLAMLCVFLNLTSLQAEELQPNMLPNTVIEELTFIDQWDKEHRLNNDTRVIIYSHHKEGSTWVKQALTSLSIDLNKSHWLYVANISKMPSLITRFIALPKMRDYAFPIALVRDNSRVKTWPVENETVAIYQLNQLELKLIDHVSDEAALVVLLEKLR